VIGLLRWEFPHAIPGMESRAALAYGNCVVLKSAELVPGCAHALAEIHLRGGAPGRRFNLVDGERPRSLRRHCVTSNT